MCESSHSCHASSAYLCFDSASPIFTITNQGESIVNFDHLLRFFVLCHRWIAHKNRATATAILPALLRIYIMTHIQNLLTGLAMGLIAGIVLALPFIPYLIGSLIWRAKIKFRYTFNAATLDIKRLNGLVGAQVHGASLCYALNATKTGAAWCKPLRLNMTTNSI